MTDESGVRHGPAALRASPAVYSLQDMDDPEMATVIRDPSPELVRSATPEALPAPRMPPMTVVPGPARDRAPSGAAPTGAPRSGAAIASSAFPGPRVVTTRSAIVQRARRGRRFWLLALALAIGTLSGFISWRVTSHLAAARAPGAPAR